MSYLAVIIASLLIASGQVLLKQALAAVAIAGRTPVELALAVAAGLFDLRAIAAIALCGAGSFVYFIGLRLHDISIVVPVAAGLIVAFVALIGWSLLDEQMTAFKIAGLLLIVGGVVLVTRTS